MADVRQCAMLRRMHDAAFQDLLEIIEFLNEMQKGLMVTMERKHKLMSGAPEKCREKFSKDLVDRISAEEVELLEKKVMREMLTERRRTKVKGWRDTDAAEGGVTQKAASGSQSSKAEVGYSDVLRLVGRAREEGHQKSAGCGGKKRVGGNAG